MRAWWLLLVVGAITLGCGAAKEAAKEGRQAASADLVAMATVESGPPSATAVSNAVRRKIIYRATVELVVDDFNPVPGKVDALVKRFDAYLAKSNVSGRPGVPRSGHWTIRVPAERYDEFLAAARELGEVRRVSSDSQDVTDEFYDVDRRIGNKKQEETRLKELLDKATGKLEEVLAVEKEITRVRGEVEQLQGRMQVLRDLTALSTVELEVDEIKDYVPEEAATYATRVGRALDASLKALWATGQDLSIAAVAAAPWLAVLAVPLVPLAIWYRARRRKKH